MTTHVSLGDLRVLGDEPRILDLKLAQALGFGKPYNIRKLIKRNEGELARYGEVWATVSQTPASEGGGFLHGGENPPSDMADAPRGVANPPSDDAGLPHGGANPTPDVDRGGRPGLEYWLNEAQAILVAVLSRTARAAEVRFEIIQVYLEHRRQKREETLPSSPGARGMFELGEQPVAELNAKINLLGLCQRLHGRIAAQRLWSQLGFPDTAADAAAAPEVKSWRRCLSHLLRQKAGFGGDQRWGDIIEIALTSGDFHEEIDLGSNGMRLDDDASGVIFANGHFGLKAIFAKTPWADGRWHHALKQAPGARRWHPQRFAGDTKRGIFIPADVLLDLAVAVDTD